MTEDAATRLGRLIRERRKSLNLTQADIQSAGGPSTATLRLIEGGKHTDFRPSTSQPLEKALHWAPGSIAAILKGDGPSVSGAIRGRSGLIETFTAVEGGEQENLRRLRLGAIIMDARDLVHSQPGPLMTALASILDEASELVVMILAEEDDDAAIADARWRIDQVRAGNSIRRQGDVYVTDNEAPIGGSPVESALIDLLPSRSTRLPIDVVWSPAQKLVTALDSHLRSHLTKSIRIEYDRAVPELIPVLNTPEGVEEYMASAVQAAADDGFEAEVFELMLKHAPAELAPAARRLAHAPQREQRAEEE